MHLRLDILYVHTKFREKLSFFVACVKNTTKKIHVHNLF
jgi:hypothetical protein